MLFRSDRCLKVGPFALVEFLELKSARIGLNKLMTVIQRAKIDILLSCDCLLLLSLLLPLKSCPAKLSCSYIATNSLFESNLLLVCPLAEETKDGGPAKGATGACWSMVLG